MVVTSSYTMKTAMQKHIYKPLQILQKCFINCKRLNEFETNPEILRFPVPLLEGDTGFESRF